MAKGSVRARAALGATLVVAVALVAAGIAVVAVLSRGLADNARLTAEAKAREVAAQVADVAASGAARVDGLDADDPVQVVDGGGRVLGASDPLRGHGPVAGFHRPDKGKPPAASASASASASGTGTGTGEGHGSGHGDSHGSGSGDEDGDGDDDRDDGDESGADDDGSATPSATPVEVDRESEDGTVTLPVDDESEVTYDKDEQAGHERFSVVAVQSATRDGTPVTVYAAASLQAQRAAVSAVTRAMLIGLPALLLVVAGVTWLVTRRALRPVEGIRGEMAAITASTDLSRRVPEPEARDEIARLARTTNETLAALESSVERQRRFVADASHELRSPIASLRTQLEVGAAHPELLNVAGAVQDTVRLQGLAADLLLLARLDAGERPGGARVALDALVREELAQRSGDRHPVRTGELAGGEVVGSPGQLARVLGNLLDNAQRHADSRVTVAVRRADGALELAVTDDGDGVPEAERARIFERFVRLDEARDRDEGGAGLGLAIARDVAERHGGTLTLGEAREGGARFVLRLPAVPPSPRS